VSDVKQRVKKLEQQAGGEGAPVVFVDWGGDTVTINGETMTRAEMERRYPDRRVVAWPDDPQS
jgi:hypothetical protein